MVSLQTSHRLLRRHPLRALYALTTIIYTILRVPLWLLTFVLFPTTRPVQAWSPTQALRVRLLRGLLHHYSMLNLRTPLSLEAGREGKRFEVVPAGEGRFFKGPLVREGVVPQEVGGTWFPARPEVKGEVGVVVIHAHGGAFTIGTGRDPGSVAGANALIAHLNTPSTPPSHRVTHLISLQYRLSSLPTCTPFPAALQDFLSAYLHLVCNLNIPPNRIVLSGDSAGSTLVLGLLRYLGAYGEDLGLGVPSAAFLWSPWTNVAAGAKALDGERGQTDYCGEAFIEWGREAYLRGLEDEEEDKLPYASPSGQPFICTTPLYVQVGGVENLKRSVKDWVQEMGEISSENGTQANNITLTITPNAPHDILMAGKNLGFEKELVDVIVVAGEWLRGVLEAGDS